MGATLLLDTGVWDILLDANGNIAVAAPPYAYAQDAASAIKTFLGECFFDTTVGVPYLTQIFGRSIPPALLKQQLINAALTVPGVASAQVYISGISGRTVSGQVQVVSSSGQTSSASFSAVNPQGAG